MMHASRLRVASGQPRRALRTELFAGCKTNNVVIVYTPWANLKKTQGMDVGQVSSAACFAPTMSVAAHRSSKRSPAPHLAAGPPRLLPVAPPVHRSASTTQPRCTRSRWSARTTTSSTGWKRRGRSATQTWLLRRRRTCPRRVSTSLRALEPWSPHGPGAQTCLSFESECTCRRFALGGSCCRVVQVRSAKRAEERAARAAEKAAKEERKKADDLKSYKHIMKVVLARVLRLRGPVYVLGAERAQLQKDRGTLEGRLGGRMTLHDPCRTRCDRPPGRVYDVE
jgi:hypothetical protein